MWIITGLFRCTWAYSIGTCFVGRGTRRKTPLFYWKWYVDSNKWNKGYRLACRSLPVLHSPKPTIFTNWSCQNTTDHLKYDGLISSVIADKTVKFSVTFYRSAGHILESTWIVPLRPDEKISSTTLSQLGLDDVSAKIITHCLRDKAAFLRSIQNG